MADTCLDKNLAQNSGTSQAQRALPALDTQYARVDERKVEDLILFAKKYGAYLNYYDLTNSVTSDWTPFMNRDMAVGIATVADWPTSNFLPYLTDLYGYINDPQAGDPSEPQAYRYIYDLVFSLATALNNVYLNLPTGVAYNDYLGSAILSNLAIPLQQLYVYYNASVSVNLFAGDTPPPDPMAPFDEMEPASALSFINSAPWVPAAFTSQPITFTAGEDLTKIINHYFFSGAVNAFINGVINIVQQTPSYLANVLENYPSHTPHYALFLTFLRLFKYAQDHINGYTGRHLEFYYKKVLQLNNNDGVPDNVHLIFQLQKNIPAHPLSANTQFKAGKDANNNNIFYGLTDDIVLNQANVQALKSLLLASPKNAAPLWLYASPIANSADGQGAKLTTADKSWNAFGDIKQVQPATIGFAIASNLLFLNEGTRTITILFDLQYPTTATFSNQTGIFKAQFTGNKKLFDTADFDSGTVSVTTNSSTSLQVVIVVNGSAPPIIPYSSKLHGGNYPQSLPMLQLTLAAADQYNVFRSLVIADIKLTVNVDSVKNLSLQNDEGPIDASKPFKLFGQFPSVGSSLIIGSKEIFQKPLYGLNVNIISPDLAIANVDQTSTQVLVKGAWDTEANSVNVETSATGIDTSTETPGSSPIGAFSAPNILYPDFTANESFKTSSASGFIRLVYNTGSDLTSYINTNKAAALVNVMGNPPNASYQVPAPATLLPGPTANALSIYYQSEIQLDYTSHFFYHIEPFGFREANPTIIQDASFTVLSTFNFDSDTSNTPEGELWIGLAGALPGYTHSILFEVSEGSSNPLENTTTVNWYYMVSNNWKQIQVEDQTENLSTSGLVVFNMPGDETTNNTRADAGLLWLKAVVNTETDAICKLISILANAAKAAFVQNVAQKIEFTANILSNTISKPAIADGVIKQITQPFGSFGGRPMETDPQFDLRVSERLRHKQRAVTAWDYERLVLQQYPQIHKVKCINHTAINTQTQQYSELKAGYVLVVTVPDLSTLAGANPLLPFTSVGLLQQINDYLSQFTSPFVQLKVCNPQLEGVRFNFMVSFKDDSNITYNKGVLDQDITNFLMPWAFGSTAQDIEFGGKIEKSVVLDFVQKHELVDFVTCFQMSQYVYDKDNQFKLLKNNTEEAVASTAMSILVPYSDPTAVLNNIIVSPADCNCDG